ncbi:glycosyltransferase family 4 protein [Tessaracoccus oleiagri]|uniref:Glycosyltransferase involved in cell wall bisynthesis n=1 Tax=Tessaracoccus oleiagri TaxID=686624 RepID=A0A1G9J9S4_9ACTN|nr:glycosyltransferase family 4 protein [Tessaracoccus oleiagri]SDL34357.1 Glycosyltransferase involved in cell wall bisynthesis [Tessaracoccus oleiagri]
MRVAYICADPGIPVFGTKGASVHVQEIVRAWRARGAEVHVYCTRLGDHRPHDLEDVAVTVMPVGKGRGATDEERTADREQQVADVSRRLARAAIADEVDVVYERFSLFSVAMSLVAQRLDVPAYLEVNAPLVEEQRDHRILVDEAWARGALRAQLHAATRVAAVSRPVADWCLAQAGDPELAARVVVAPNGVNVDRIAPVVPGTEPTVLFVGTLKPWHGTEHLIRAAALAGRRWRLRIVGDGPQGSALRDLADSLGVAVDFVGAVPPEGIPAAMAGAWVAAAPYPEQRDQYFSPLKVFEYSAAALPVVASRVGQIPTIVRDGETGLLVEPSRPDQLAAAIDRLVADAATARRMGAAGRELMTGRHTWEKVLARTIEGEHARV